MENGEKGDKGDTGATGATGANGTTESKNWIAWIAAIISMVLVAIILGNDVHQNRKSIRELNKTKADVSQLQGSNCVLKTTLLNARIKSFKRLIKQGQTIKEATTGVTTLTVIINGLDGERYCPTAKKYKLPKVKERTPNA